MLFIYLTFWFDINVYFGIPTGGFVITTPKGLLFYFILCNLCVNK